MSNRRPIPELTYEEEARIQAGIASDPDNPEWTEEDFKSAKSFAEVFPELMQKIRDGRMGGIEQVGVDIRIVDKFRQQGDDWRERMNEVLRKAVGL